VSTPPALAGGLGLRLKAGSVGHAADYSFMLAVTGGFADPPSGL
jgi:hypothetical protein